MSDALERLAEARLAERKARANWQYSLGVAQSRLAPKAIARDTVDRVKSGATDIVESATGAVRRNPGTVIAVGAAIGLFLFRKPIAAAVRKQFERRRTKKEPVRPIEKAEAGRGPLPDPTPKAIVNEEIAS